MQSKKRFLTEKIGHLESSMLLNYLNSNPNIWLENEFRRNLYGLESTESILIFYNTDNAKSMTPTQITSDQTIVSLLKPFTSMINNLTGMNELSRLLIAKLPQKTIIGLHKDPIEFAEYQRFHWVLQTNNNCHMQVNTKKYFFDKDEIWSFENQKIHGATNDGDSDRIHLIADFKKIF
jgi:hypothetical protein